ncbi:hypothetical protein AB0J52_21785 [Spirillospora sp. NPDC049652]
MTAQAPSPDSRRPAAAPSRCSDQPSDAPDPADVPAAQKAEEPESGASRASRPAKADVPAARAGEHPAEEDGKVVAARDEAVRPVRGTAAGLRYVALPPTAVDARASGPTRLVLAWPGFDPPRTAAAMATAVPMTGVPTWRVYLDLPHADDAAAALPTGLDSQGLLTEAGITAFGTAVEGAAALLPDVLADLRRDLGVPADPVALAGFSAGAAVVLLALARQDVQVSTAALVAPVVSPARVARSVEKRSGRERSWSPAATELAERLDLSAQAGRIAESGAALLLIGGARDRIVPGTQVTALRDLLARCGAPAVEAAAFRMGHALAAAPGVEARPPITEAVRVDGVLTDWFRERLAEPGPRPAPPVALHLTGTST